MSEHITAAGVSRLLSEGGVLTSHAARRRFEGTFVTGRGKNSTEVSVTVDIDAPGQRNRVAAEAIRILEEGGYVVKASTVPHPEHGEFYASEHLIVTRLAK